MSQVNHNYSYLFEIDGITPWERLRVVRNFLTDRTKALGLAELALRTTKEDRDHRLEIIKLDELTLAQVHLTLDDIIAEVTSWLLADDDLTTALNRSNDYLGFKRTALTIANRIRKSRNKLEKTELELMDHEDLTQDCRDEIAFLKNFEAKLIEACEPSRIDGATDREMYELNFPEEARTRLFLRCVNETAATGAISSDILAYVRRDQIVVDRLVSANVITAQLAGFLKVGMDDTSHAIPQLVTPDPISALPLLSKEK